MRKILMLAILTMLVLPTVFALPLIEIEKQRIELVQKNPIDWSVVDGAKGIVTLSYSEDTIRGIYNGKQVRFLRYYPRVKALAWGLEKYTDYTLIYYGFDGFNDVYPYATCISQDKTNRQGQLEMKAYNFNWVPFIDDGINQKFWIVKSSDVDCINHKMIAWNAKDYLFETKTI